MRTVILLECDVPADLDPSEALGAITGVLAQHGALGVHETSLGDVGVRLAAAGRIDHGFDAEETIRSLLVFDDSRNPRHVAVGGDA